MSHTHMNTPVLYRLHDDVLCFARPSLAAFWQVITQADCFYGLRTPVKVTFYPGEREGVGCTDPWLGSSHWPAQQTCPRSLRPTFWDFTYQNVITCHIERVTNCLYFFPFYLCPSFSYPGIVLTWVRRCYGLPHSYIWPFYVHAVNGLAGSIVISGHWIIWMSS